MKFRKITTPAGKSFRVPQCVQRIDSSSTHGWQVRYHGTKLFSDGAAGAATSLKLATQELLARIARHPAPVRLLRAPSAHKSSSLPPGISGPIVQEGSTGRGRSAHLSVLLPRYGQPPQVRKIHIGTERTYTPARYRAALAEAKALRAEAETAYRTAATRDRRAQAKQLRERLGTRRG